MPQDRFMQRALELARRGRPFVAPNPMVGAVIVKGGEVVGEGWHEAFGGPHAEVNALNAVGDNALGATMYLTLEPCCEAFEGKKTPPCAPQLIKAGLKRVVIATPDPHPSVQGRGARMLEEAGIEVQIGVLEGQARELNAAFFQYVKTGRPLVTAKWAMTLDGKIATRTGESRWISGGESRREVHEDRACAGAVIVGPGTVARDDPMLTVRGVEGRQPLRVVIDRDLSIALDRKLVKMANEFPVLVYCADDAPEDKRRQLEAAGLAIVPLPSRDGHLAWSDVLDDLGGRRVISAIVEGGGGLLASAFEQQAVDSVKVFVAPKVFGGQDAPTPVEGLGVAEIAGAVTFINGRTRMSGEDVVIEAKPIYPDHRDVQTAIANDQIG